MAKISLFANQFQDRFIIERQGLADIARIETDNDRSDATFEWTGPNLRPGATGQLRRATPLLGVVLRNATFLDFRIEGKFAENIEDPATAAEVREESTFVLEEGLIDPNHLTFRSVKFPDRVIRHRQFHLFAERVNTPADFQDATFRFVPPLLAGT